MRHYNASASNLGSTDQILGPEYQATSVNNLAGATNRVDLSSSKSDLQQSLLNPFLGDNTQTTLFHLNAQQPTSFLKRRRPAPGSFSSSKGGTPTGYFANTIVTGINKLTFGGLDKVSSGFDKLKYIVKYPKDVLDTQEISPRKSRSLKRFGSRKKDDSSRDDSTSPVKGIRRMSFKMSRGDRSKPEQRTLERPSPSRTMVPRAEPSKGRNRESEGEVTDEGHISDSAILTKGNFVASPLSGHRRLRSDQTGLINNFDKAYEPITRNRDIQRVMESEAASESESEQSSVDADDQGSRQDLLNEPLMPLRRMPSLSKVPSKPKEPSSMYDYWKMILYLYSEARLGPSKIGILDLSRYSHCQLEDSFLELLDEIFGLSSRFSWVWTQSFFIVKPFANYFARPIINRCVNFFLKT